MKSRSGPGSPQKNLGSIDQPIHGGLYAQFLRVLLRKSLITPDDYEVYQQICPLFDPVYAPYR